MPRGMLASAMSLIELNKKIIVQFSQRGDNQNTLGNVLLTPQTLYQAHFGYQQQAPDTGSNSLPTLLRVQGEDCDKVNATGPTFPLDLHRLPTRVPPDTSILFLALYLTRLHLMFCIPSPRPLVFQKWSTQMANYRPLKRSRRV